MRRLILIALIASLLVASGCKLLSTYRFYWKLSERVYRGSGEYWLRIELDRPNVPCDAWFFTFVVGRHRGPLITFTRHRRIDLVCQFGFRTEFLGCIKILR